MNKETSISKKREPLEKVSTTREQYRRQASETDVNRQDWILNLSSYDLTTPERKVLKQSLNFTPAPSCVPKTDIIANVESGLRYHKDEGAAHQTRPARNILRKAKPPRRNITAEEKDALSKLRQNEKIVIAKADKGNMTVVMDKETYYKKAADLFNAKPFRKISSDPTKKIERKLNAQLKKLLDSKSIVKPLYDHLRVSLNFSRPALFHGLPKIHKPNVPLRPIVSYVGHALYQTSK